jgi:hypothetical protein
MTPETFSAEWVDAIFARLSLAYGQRFTAQWEGLNPEHVKASWRRELQGITSRGIAYALGHLPGDFPPNAMQFKALCVGAPARNDPVRTLLDGPAPTPASVARLQAAIAPLRRPKDAKAWARALQAREVGGERLSRMQREAWRTALSFSDRTEQPSNGAGSSPIQEDSL